MRAEIKMIQLTIAVPAYNAENCLVRCLDSLAHPRFDGRLEVVVVDDGSTDQTRRIADRFAARMPGRFHVISQKNSGHGGAVNTGLRAARGRYFRIVDADDWVDADGLAALLDAMGKMDPDLFIDERVERFDERADRIALPEDAPAGKVVDFHALTDPRFDRNIDMHTITARTALLRERGIVLMTNTYYVDMQYVVGVACFARTAVLIRRTVYQYQLGVSGQSVNPLNFARNYEQHNSVLLACVDYFVRNGALLPPGRADYVRRRLKLLANTQYNIAYIYNPDRREGRLQARRFSRYLDRKIPWLSRATRRRRMAGRVLNTLGVNYDGLKRLKEATGRR